MKTATVQFVGTFYLSVNVPDDASEMEARRIAQADYNSMSTARLNEILVNVVFDPVPSNHVEIPKMVLDIIKNYWNTQLRRSKQSVDVVSLMRFTEGIAYAYGSSNKALSNKLYDICNNLNTSEFCELFDLK